jgi:hypothetical protein
MFSPLLLVSRFCKAAPMAAGDAGGGGAIRPRRGSHLHAGKNQCQNNYETV